MILHDLEERVVSALKHVQGDTHPICRLVFELAYKLNEAEEKLLNEAHAYVLVKETESGTTHFHTETVTGEKVALLFTTRVQAEAWCQRCQVSRPWPIVPLTRQETRAWLSAHVEAGTRWMCLGENKVVDVAQVNAALEELDELEELADGRC
jgi:hypothetical protein